MDRQGLSSDPPGCVKRLKASERSLLEDILADKFSGNPRDLGAAVPPDEATRCAMHAWLMVQSARLRRFSRSANALIIQDTNNRLEAAGFSMRDCINLGHPRTLPARLAAEAPFKNAHDASTRPEYAAALNNFLKYLNPSEPLHPTLRGMVAEAFNQMRSEGRISPGFEHEVSQKGIEALVREKYRLNEANGNFESEAQRTTEWAAGQTSHARVVPSAPPEALQLSGPASSGQAGSLSRSDSHLSQQSILEMPAWMKPRGTDHLR